MSDKVPSTAVLRKLTFNMSLFTIHTNINYGHKYLAIFANHLDKFMMFFCCCLFLFFVFLVCWANHSIDTITKHRGHKNRKHKGSLT